jgi:flagellin-like hook-associated protein FlgL
VRKITWILVLLLVGQSLSAQDTKTSGSRDARQEKKQKRKDKINALIKQEEEGALVFHKQNTFGIRVNTDGYSVFFEKGWMQSAKKANLLSFEIGEKKHPKEHKSTLTDNSFFVTTNPFVYGKRNIFYQFKVSAGQQIILGYRGNKNGVSIAGVYAGGVSVGLLRPYYLRVQRPNGNLVEDIKYSVADSADFLGNTIIEGTGLKHGWNELKFAPGLHARVGLRFDYGRFNEMVSAIEVGLNAEYYFKEPEIMLLTSNRKFLFSAYASINFGRRK